MELITQEVARRSTVLALTDQIRKGGAVEQEPRTRGGIHCRDPFIAPLFRKRVVDRGTGGPREGKSGPLFRTMR